MLEPLRRLEYGLQMSDRYIYHMCPRTSWEAAITNGTYQGGELDQKDGFIHFSSPDQVVETAKRHLSGREGLVLLRVDAARLGEALKWERSRNGMLFPHLYNALNPNDVEAVFELHLDAAGDHIFPEIR